MNNFNWSFWNMLLSHFPIWPLKIITLSIDQLGTINFKNHFHLKLYIVQNIVLHLKWLCYMFQTVDNYIKNDNQVKYQKRNSQHDNERS